MLDDAGYGGQNTYGLFSITNVSMNIFNKSVTVLVMVNSPDNVSVCAAVN
jgi:hypothetical protein